MNCVPNQAETELKPYDSWARNDIQILNSSVLALSQAGKSTMGIEPNCTKKKTDHESDWD